MREKFIAEILENENILEIWATFESVCSLKLKFPLLVWGGGFSVGAISSFVDNWIFAPSVTYWALIGLIAADHFSGVYLAYKTNRFETRKALRVFWTLTAHTALLFFSNQLSKGSVSLFWLNEGVFVPIVLVNFLSLIKNLSLLGWINSGVAEFFYKKIDRHKNQYIEDEKRD